MSEFPFWYQYSSNGKDRCNYCGKKPEFISQHPGFHFNKLGCYSCVSTGCLTPHYRTLYTFDLGNLVYHVDADERGISKIVATHERYRNGACGWCLEDVYPAVKRNKAVRKSNRIKCSTVTKKRKRDCDDYTPEPEPEKGTSQLYEIVIDCSDI